MEIVYGKDVMKRAVATIILFILMVDGTSALPIEEWNRTFGGVVDYYAYSAQQTMDGGYILGGGVGRPCPTGKVCPIPYAILIKTDENGNMLWNKSFDGFVYTVQQTADAGYILFGPNCLIKTDENGNIIWNKTFGKGFDSVNSGQQTEDGGYIFAGFHDYDAWLIKTDANGEQLWNKTFGGVINDYAKSVQQTKDGGYVFSGVTTSYGDGYGSVWLVKTDANGEQLWNRTFGGLSYDYANYVQQAKDGGYIITGGTLSYGKGLQDVYLLKTDANGKLEWNRTFGGISTDYANYVKQTKDGGYIITASTDSFEQGHAWLIKTDAKGKELWNKTFGTMSNDRVYSVQQTLDDGYILAGETVSYGEGKSKAWLIKVSEKSASITPQINITKIQPTTIPPGTTKPTIVKPTENFTPQVANVSETTPKETILQRKTPSFETVMSLLILIYISRMRRS